MSELSLRVKTAVILIMIYGVSIYFGGLLFTLVLLVSLLVFLLELKNIVDFKKMIKKNIKSFFSRKKNNDGMYYIYLNTLILLDTTVIR